MCLCRMPVQYVIEEWDFRDLTLKMRPPVFIPRPETEVRQEKKRAMHAIQCTVSSQWSVIRNQSCVFSVCWCRSWLNSCSLIWKWSPELKWVQTASVRAWKWGVALAPFLLVCWIVCLRWGLCLIVGMRFLATSHHQNITTTFAWIELWCRRSCFPQDELD